MSIKLHNLENGFQIMVSRYKSGKTSSITIFDHKIYPDNDSRSQDYWRHSGLTIPINNDEDLKAISKMFKKICKNN